MQQKFNIIRKDLLKYLHQNPHAYWLLGLPIYLILFFWLDLTKEPKYLIHSPLDDFIPFNAWFAIPYFLWFAAFPGSLLLFLRANKQDFLRLSFIMYTSSLFTFAIYFFFPTELALRPIEVGDNLLCRLMQLIWLVDAPNNVCPSLHVSISTAIALVCHHSAELVKRPLLRCAIILLMISICLSTVFVKQHSVLDIFAGATVSLLFYYPVYHTKWGQRTFSK